MVAKRYTDGRGFLVDAIVQALEDEGPMTRDELCRRLGQHRQSMSSVLSRMRRPMSSMPKRVYISHYVYDSEQGRRYPRAVYAIGDMEDAKRPGPQKKLNKKRYDTAMRNKFALNSVFNIGLPRRIYEKVRERT